MKAVRIHDYGDRSVLRYEDCPQPDIGDNEVLVRVIAAAVNPVDWKIRRGLLREVVPHQLPLTLGWDLAGIVEQVGDAASRFQVGDAVYSRPDLARDGACAQYIAVRESELALKPATLSFADAASIPLAGITAWQSLFESANLEPGQTVLIHAAAGGVGSLAVQLARHRGARVIATCSARNRALVTSLGADQVIDYRKQHFQNLLGDLDVVFDTLGGQVQEHSWSVLKPGGTLVSIVQPPSEARARQAGVAGRFVFIQPNARILGELAALLDAGKLRPVIGAEYSLGDLAVAHELSESGRAVGKIVIHVGQP